MSMVTPDGKQALDAQIEHLRLAGAAGVDAVQWHYIETLAERLRLLPDPAQALLRQKLAQTLQAFESRMTAHGTKAVEPEPQQAPSPMALLLQEMAPQPMATASGQSTWMPAHQESPRVQQFRKQLRTLSVQKQVSHAISQAPQNAGPINSHMLVLRALGLMRELSPDYLQRFMAYVNTLMVLEKAVVPTPGKSGARKTTGTRKTAKT